MGLRSSVLDSDYAARLVFSHVPPDDLYSYTYSYTNDPLSFSTETIIAALSKRGKSGLHSLTAVSNNAGTTAGGGLTPLVNSGQIDRLILSFLGANKSLEKKYLGGEIAIELCPQGTIAERIRAGGAGIPAFFTPTGISTYNIEALERKPC